MLKVDVFRNYERAIRTVCSPGFSRPGIRAHNALFYAKPAKAGTTNLLKLYRAVHSSALRASRYFHIRVVRVNGTALVASKNFIMLARRFKPPAAKLGIYCQD